MKRRYAVVPPRLIPTPEDLELLGKEDCEFLLDVVQGKQKPIPDPDWQRLRGILARFIDDVDLCEALERTCRRKIADVPLRQRKYAAVR